MAKRTKAQQAEYDEAITKLRDWIKPGDTVYTILRQVSRSGMSRQISVVLLARDDRDPSRTVDLHPNHAVSLVTGYPLNKTRDAIVIGGCGMDMGFQLVYQLSQALYGGRTCGCVGPRRDGIPVTAAEYHARGDLGPAEGWTWTADSRCSICQGSGILPGSGYACLGKGTCPSNYHVNHRDRVRCPGTSGADGRSCYTPSPFGRWPIAADWPEADGRLLACVAFKDDEGNGAYEVCPTCQGAGDLANPDGPERWDLVHTDGYALRHRWL